MIRLFVEHPLAPNAEFFLGEKQVHYLFHVMKKEAGEQVFCFDGKSGEYLCQILEIGKKSCRLKALEQTKTFAQSPDIWLLFAPLKKDNTDFVVEKATELGVKKIIPVLTRFTIAEKVRLERLRAQAVEASEQCRRLDVPEISEAVPLSKLLSAWDASRPLFFMSERTTEANTVFSVFNDPKNQTPSIAILVGPEGGFSPEEAELLNKLPFAKTVSLGPRILRAETAATAALACWQAISGDWK